jgi:ribose-phosphate pyrophosphokinase
LLCDALRRKGVKEITAVIPWLGYSKQDKVFRSGEPLSVKVIAKMIQSVSLERIITFDLHNLAILGFFEIPVTNLSASSMFLDYFEKSKNGHTLVVAPDAGAVKSSTAFAQKLGVGVAYVDKKRDLKTGKVTIHDINRSIKGHDVLVVDDMIATGGTLIETAKFVKKKGASSVRVAATHHLYVNGTQEKLEKSPIDELVVSDTIKKAGKYDKLKVLSVADLLVEELN